jgi:hypothetical protein
VYIKIFALMMLIQSNVTGQSKNLVNFFHVKINVEKTVDDRNEWNLSYLSIRCNPFNVSGDSLLVDANLLVASGDDRIKAYVLVEYISNIHNSKYSDFANGYIEKNSQMPFYSLLDKDLTKIFSLDSEQLYPHTGTYQQCSSSLKEIEYCSDEQDSIEKYQIWVYKELVFVRVRGTFDCY